MKSNLTRFFVGLACLIAVMAFITVVVKNAVPQYVSPYWMLLLPLFAIVCIVVYFLTMWMRNKGDASKFTAFYMGTTIVKLMLYLAIIIMYVLIFKENVKPFIYTFLAYYLCFSIFETYSLTKKK